MIGGERSGLISESVPWEGVWRRTLVGPGKGAVLESLPWCYQLHIEDSLLDMSSCLRKFIFYFALGFFFFSCFSLHLALL